MSSAALEVADREPPLGAQVGPGGTEESREGPEKKEEGADRPPPRAALDSLLAAFVRLHAGLRQHDPAWYGLPTFGGSSMAALMGRDRYKSLFSLVAQKVALQRAGPQGHDQGKGSASGPACWWGTLFQDIIGAYVEIDLGGTVIGGEMCIQGVIPGHHYSPDGYIVARLCWGADGALCLWTTDMSPDIPVLWAIFLLEFKCPASRKPNGRVPPQYQPQVWAGLAVSPLAYAGIYVDAVFRKCALSDLGDSPGFDAEYHRSDPRGWGPPVAWGLIGVYAPALDAPRSQRYGWGGAEWAPGDPDPDNADADASVAAWQIFRGCLRPPFFVWEGEGGGGCGGALESARNTVADLGAMEPAPFRRALGLIDRKRFTVARLPPCFADGRGADLRSAGAIDAAIGALRARAPSGCWLFGVLPWKLFEVYYTPVERRPGFAEEIGALVSRAHALVAGACAAPDPTAFLLGELGNGGARFVPAESPPTPLYTAEVQDLFDAISLEPCSGPGIAGLARGSGGDSGGDGGGGAAEKGRLEGVVLDPAVADREAGS